MKNKKTPTRKKTEKPLSFSSAMYQFFNDDIPLTSELASYRYEIKPTKLVDNIRQRIPGAIYQNISTVLTDLVKQYGGGTYSLFIEAFHGTTGEKIAFTKVENLHLLGEDQPLKAPAVLTPVQPAQPQQSEALEFMKIMLEKSESNKREMLEMMNNNLKMVIAMKQPTSQRDNFKEALNLGMKIAKGQLPDEPDDGGEDDSEESNPVMNAVGMISKAISEFAPLAKQFLTPDGKPSQLPAEYNDPKLVAMVELYRQHPELFPDAEQTTAIDITDQKEVTEKTPEP